MPISGSGAGRVETFYSVIRKISNREWTEFARAEGGLHLPSNVIDDIQYDHHNNIKEQKFQMLCKWEQRLGREATSNRLVQLADRFLEQNQNINLVEPAAVNQSSQPIPQSDQSRVPMDRETRKFQELLTKISLRLDDRDVNALKITYNLTDRRFESSLELTYYLVNSGVFGVSLREKVESLENAMDLVGRNDLSAIIRDEWREFRQPEDAHDAFVQEPSTSQGNNRRGNTSRSTGSSSSIRSNSIVNSSLNNANVNMSAGDTIAASGGRDSSFNNAQSSASSSRYSSNSISGSRISSSNISMRSGDTIRVGSKSYTEVPEEEDEASVSSLSNSPVTSYLPAEREIKNLTRRVEGQAQPQPGIQISLGNSQANPGVSIQSLNLNFYGNADHVNLPGGIQNFQNQQSAPAIETTADEGVGDIENMCSYARTDVVVVPTTKRNFDILKGKPDIYTIKSKPKGHVLILSNIEFPSWGQRYTRTGGKKDCDRMKNLFGPNGLGLDVTVKEDCTAERMWSLLESFANDDRHANADMCVLIIMTHGGYGAAEGDFFYGTDAGKVLTQDALRLFDNDNCPNLLGKPKLFFLQYCRGHSADRGVPVSGDNTDSSSYPTFSVPSPTDCLNRLLPQVDSTDGPTSSYPTRSDVLIAYSTQQGDYSFRSWFTNAIVNVFSQKAHKNHLCDMLKEVKRGLAKKEAYTLQKDTHKGKEMADIRDILLKNLYFFPGHPG